MDIKVIKKDNRIVDFDGKKIVDAVTHSASRVHVEISDGEFDWLVNRVRELCLRKVINKDEEGTINVPVSDIHTYVEMSLEELNKEVAHSYENYRNWKKAYSAMWDRCAKMAQSIMYRGDKENANANSKLVSTKRSLIFNVYNTELYRSYTISEKVRKAHDEGFIYVHDMSARRDTMNCCLFDMAAVLKDGFDSHNGLIYTEPKSLDVAGDVIGDIILMAASQQYGGFTVSEIDKVLEPYAQKTYDRIYKCQTENLKEFADELFNNFYQKVLKKDFDKEKGVVGPALYKMVETLAAKYADKKAMAQVQKEMDGVFQGWEYKFNTVASSRGDYPFITLSFGLSTSTFGKMASKSCLKVRMKGQGKEGAKKPVLFPKLVFLYDENLHGEGKENEDVFEAAIACSQKAMYPDYLSLTGIANGEEVYGTVPYMYRHYKKVISPMGCRAFLSPWFERGGMYPADEFDEPVYVGRFNIGAVSLNLPMIYMKSKLEDLDFYETLDEYLEIIRQLHLDTYEYLGKMKASTNPLAYCEGGFYGGHLNPDDNIEPLLDSATASFGVTALNELQYLYNHKTLLEDNSFALEVMDHINSKVAEFKKADGRLYAIYGTPAENLSGKQVEKFKAKFGFVDGVSDREYFTNSFHLHVTEKVTPTEKQDREEVFWDKFAGGRIQYVRLVFGENPDAVRALVRRAMAKGFYFGVNMALSYCIECGYEGTNLDVCPRCGSRNLEKMDRICGYLGFTRQGDTSTHNAHMKFSGVSVEERLKTVNKEAVGEARTSHHKSAEIADRVSM